MFFSLVASEISCRNVPNQGLPCIKQASADVLMMAMKHLSAKSCPVSIMSPMFVASIHVYPPAIKHGHGKAIIHRVYHIEYRQCLILEMRNEKYFHHSPSPMHLTLNVGYFSLSLGEIRRQRPPVPMDYHYHHILYFISGYS